MLRLVCHHTTFFFLFANFLTTCSNKLEKNKDKFIFLNIKLIYFDYDECCWISYPLWGLNWRGTQSHKRINQSHKVEGASPVSNLRTFLPLSLMLKAKPQRGYCFCQPEYTASPDILFHSHLPGAHILGTSQYFI